MKDWINRNIEGGPLAVFILAALAAYGLGSLWSHDMRLNEYRTQHELVHIDGWIKASDLQHIHFQEEK